MKKILVTGAAGTIGIPVISHLLASGDYEITAVDLKSKRSVKRLKRYQNKINVVYGDIHDNRLMKSLVRDHDYIIHLAGVVPPFADIKNDLSKIVDYDGTKHIIKLINEYNPKCFLIFASTTTVYGDVSDEVDVNSEIIAEAEDLFALSKIRCEEKIKDKLKNYTIFRFPAVLGDLKYEAPMYHIGFNSKVEFITADDAGHALVKAIENKTKLNKKTFNVTGGDDCRIIFKDFVIRVLEVHGLSMRYLTTRMLVDNNFYSHYYSDSKNIQNILKYQTESLDDYFHKITKKNSKLTRFFPKLFAKPFIFLIKRKK